MNSNLSSRRHYWWKTHKLKPSLCWRFETPEPTCRWWPWWRGSSSGLQEGGLCDLYSRAAQQSISPLISPDPWHTLQTAHACSYRHSTAWGGRMRGVPALPTVVGLALQHACETPAILFIIFSSQAWTHVSSVHLSYFMSGWAGKTEGNMRLLISTLTPGWTDVTTSSLVILTDFCEDKDSTEIKRNVKRGRKCPTIQWKTSLYPLCWDDGVVWSCHLLVSVITNLLIINYSKVDIFIANGP